MRRVRVRTDMAGSPPGFLRCCRGSGDDSSKARAVNSVNDDSRNLSVHV
ncbi:hypothetical protein KCH_46560 [Kitasatospora cheerisanensis KCTC 2395]|uniref:Uncharacterized protein n=1 Tax=Kitasatospora cheerisanensis KCTC 2395 TaxID=1348663 RepID=A0A066YT96_9ACTN|nr:hypothetical protein KCH_46560 [Kitasatospora cheerisanensis KCTC 2395]